jgi:hypothetical protein
MHDRHGSRALVSIGLGVALAAAAGLGAQRGAAPPQPAANQATPSPQVGTAAISGVVIDGSTGQPVSGAVVLIIGRGARGSLPGLTRAAVDGQGRFVFARLPAGDYSVAATKFGYLTMRYGQSDPSSYSQRSIQLSDGQWFSGARIAIWRPGAISGTITDEAGEPIVGAPVRVLAHVMVAGRPQIAAGTIGRTDDRGWYRVAGLAKGRYVVMVPSVQASVPADTTLVDLAGFTSDMLKAAEAAGRPITLPYTPAVVVDASNRLIVGNYAAPPPVSGGAWAYPPTFFPAARAIADATVIDLAFSEERSNIDIRLAPVRSVRVSGVVQAPSDALPVGMTLRLLPGGSETLGLGAETATALVNSTGAFTLLNVPSGTYTIVVSRSSMEYMVGDALSMYALPAPPGWGESSTGMGVIGSGSGGARYSFRNARGNAEYSARMTLTVGDQNLTGVLVQLRRAVTLSGRIVRLSGSGNAEVTAGRMAMPIYAEPANGDATLGMPTGSSLPGDSNKFRIDGLLPGGYTLRVISLGGGAVKSIEWQGRDYTDRAFDASAGRDIEDVVITLTTDMAKVAGMVRDAKNLLATTGAVIVFPADRSLWSGYGFRPSRLVSSSVSTGGAFSISSLPAGEYLIVAVDDTLADAWQDPKFLEAASVLASRMTIGWGETKNMDLTISAVKVR